MAIVPIINKLRESGYSGGFINRSLFWLNAQSKTFVKSLGDPAQYIIDNEYLINHSAIAHEHDCNRCHKTIFCRAIGCEAPKWAECLYCSKQ